MRKLSVFLVGLTIILLPSFVFAGFDQNKVIDDDAFTNWGSMNGQQIQDFLNSKGSVLTNFKEGGRSAASIIYDAAKEHRINPQVLLATLQKEQSLITTGTSYDTNADSSGKLRKAMGYACPDSGGCDSRYAGFTNQVDGAAFQFRFNFDGSTTRRFSDYQVNQTMSFDGTPVVLLNQATASLYRYTPHISGNRSFYTIYFTYFLEYSSKYAWQNSYPTLAPGDSYQFRLNFENIGNKVWDRSIVKLGTDRPRDRVSRFLRENKLNGDETMWSSANRVAMRQQSVPVGGVGSFDFYMTVPNNLGAGTYREYFRPVAEGVQWMDDEQVYWDVIVANHEAGWAGQNFGRKRVEPGESVLLEVGLRNTGQTTWRRDGNTPVRLGTSRNQDRLPAFIREDLQGGNASGWTNPNRITMVESEVAPGSIGNFKFWYTIPASAKPGLYREYFQPVHENVRWMNDLGIFFELEVGSQRAAWAGQSGYPTLSKNESAEFWVSFRNEGKTTWTKNGNTPMRLGTQRAQDRMPLFIREDVQGRNPSGWLQQNRIEMIQDSVAPGETGTFKFWYTVPGDKAPGTYREYFGLVQENYAWLPDTGVYWDIVVR